MPNFDPIETNASPRRRAALAADFPLEMEAQIRPSDVSVRRTLDPTFLNEVINHPEVRPGVHGDGHIDVGRLTCDPRNFALQSAYGGFLLTLQTPGIYEVHSQFLPGHGAHPAKAMASAMEYMFTRTDCEKIVSRVPASNRPAKGLAQIGGLRTIFQRDDEQLGACEYVEIDLMDWAMRTKSLEAHGMRFHDFLEDARKAVGASWPDHPQDPAHERAVGATLLMFERGQPIKGATFYNRWARLAGYPVITLVSSNPLVLDMSAGEEAVAILGIGTDGLEMLLCR